MKIHFKASVIFLLTGLAAWDSYQHFYKSRELDQQTIQEVARELGDRAIGWDVEITPGVNQGWINDKDLNNQHIGLHTFVDCSNTQAIKTVARENRFHAFENNKKFVYFFEQGRRSYTVRAQRTLLRPWNNYELVHSKAALSEKIDCIAPATKGWGNRLLSLTQKSPVTSQTTTPVSVNIGEQQLSFYIYRDSTGHPISSTALVDNIHSISELKAVHDKVLTQIAISGTYPSFTDEWESMDGATDIIWSKTQVFQQTKPSKGLLVLSSEYSTDQKSSKKVKQLRFVVTPGN